MKGPVPRPKGRTGHRIDVGRFSLRDVGVLVGGLNGVLDGLVRLVIRCRILREGDQYRISGKKWWTTGAMDPRCKFFIVMGETNPEAKPYARQSMVIVPAPAS